MEYPLFEFLSFRIGAIYSVRQTAKALLAFSEFQPENNLTYFTFGLAHLNKIFETELYGFFGEQTPASNACNLKRDQWGILFSIKYYRD